MTESFEKYLLEKMLRKRIIGSKHIRYENILSGIPPHEIKSLKEAVESLLRKGFLVWYSKSKKAIQLNKERLKEIKEYLISE
ncbi:MAG TPA: hypothetical protein VJB08_05485 [Candidatus Nanoarchaeia archaeon]|nr:hypothetical protein [Candidatus Nanoarchaeia archaeon]